MILEARELYSGYVGVDIIKNISLEVQEKQLLCIIGPNGSGKSTLLKTIFGILRPRKGSVYFKGKDVTNLRTWEKLRMGLVYVPQGRNVFANMTVEENLELGAYVIDNRKEVKDRIEIAYKKYPLLKDRRKQLSGSMSGGEQQILQLARALLLNPSVLLVDEPTAGLAPKAAAQIFDEMRALRDEKVTIILVEQNAKKALSISDRALVLAQGEKTLEGTGAEMLENKKVRDMYLGGA